MNIEELKELKSEVEATLNEVGQIHLWDEQNPWLVMELINAEIERQSVTDEDVDEAIETIEREFEGYLNASPIEDDIENSHRDYHIGMCLDLALQALKAYRKPEPSDDCTLNDSAFGTCQCGYEFNSELISEYQIKHCPNCGRKLGDET